MLKNPAVPQAQEITKKLFRAAHAFSRPRVTLPPQEEECEDCGGASCNIILTCCEFDRPYHLHCIRRRHFDMKYGFDYLLRCRHCSALAKPINIAWLVMPKEERDDRRRRKHETSRARRLLQKKTNDEVKEKERVRYTQRMRRRRARRKAKSNSDDQVRQFFSCLD
ncbi:hypothetical protein C8F04DRAFT_1190226 [Mycena alexandri]|uniref:Uncharacterized protein n=1 Tax=Mycena alexandri TaxID=1745969 RepID=A0AAD6SG19_9AGAR|nr:hypothetical protein C8F04DRAFT_1190226 [Mycena alexandri]